MSIGLGFCDAASPDCSDLYPTIFIIIIVVVLIIICGPWCIFACSDKVAQDSIKETVGTFKAKTRNVIQQRTPFRKYYVKNPTMSSYNIENENKVMITIDDNVFDV